MASNPETGKHQVLPEPEHHHTGWYCCAANLVVMAERIRAGECVVVPIETPRVSFVWCVTHACEETWGHKLDIAQGRRDAEVLHNG